MTTNFAHLKGKNKGVNVDVGDTKSAPNKEDKSKQKSTDKVIKKNDRILASKFCHGCLNVSVDAMGTELEKWWCGRNKIDDDGKKFVDWVPISKTVLIRQCPKVKNGDFKI